MNRKIIVTEDNSKTLLIPELNETYHSTHGALTEAKHVFIKEGLERISSLKKVNILEMGFGTGLNLLVSLENNREKNQHIYYRTIEKYPVKIETVKELEYVNNFPETTVRDSYIKAHECDWETEIDLSSHFKFKKLHTDFKKAGIENESIDILYYDAFGPRVQPDLWNMETLEIAYSFLKPNGILVTYCAQGQFKRNLKELGFEVECPSGPPGKREMVRATKK